MKLTKRCIWFILICGIACTLGVNPVFADSDQTTDGEFGGVSAANEVSYEYDSTINEFFSTSYTNKQSYPGTSLSFKCMDFLKQKHDFPHTYPGNDAVTPQSQKVFFPEGDFTAIFPENTR